MRLSDKQLAHFRDNGYLAIEGFFSSTEAKALRLELERIYNTELEKRYRYQLCSASRWHQAGQRRRSTEPSGDPAEQSQRLTQGVAVSSEGYLCC